MFWLKKKSKENKKSTEQDKRQESVGTTSKGQRTSEDIRAEALANAKAARENLGEDTVQRIAEIMKRKENSPMAKAEAQIQEADPDRVLEELKYILDSKE